MDNSKRLNTYGEKLTMPETFQKIGYAHQETSQSISIDKEKVQENFMHYHKKCIQFQERFDQYIEEFEQKRYMSPVELMVCTHYRDINYLFNELFNRIERFNSELLQISEWKYCRCFGDKNIKHLLVKRHLYKNSHEHYFNGSAVLDVVAMIRCHVTYFEWQDTDLTENFGVYLESNQLEQVELELLGIYLLDPTEYFQAVEDYATRATSKSMMEHTIILNRLHRFATGMLGWTINNLAAKPGDSDD
ncbi:hypothetical protein [Virgibacillus phasianinus]|nr:hypothetical protein [Virgibacillus phasianinus]